MVFVKSIAGNTLTIELPSNASVQRIKRSIQEIEGIDVDQQRLTFSGDYLISLPNLESY